MAPHALEIDGHCEHPCLADTLPNAHPLSHSPHLALIRWHSIHYTSFKTEAIQGLMEYGTMEALIELGVGHHTTHAHTHVRTHTHKHAHHTIYLLCFASLLDNVEADISSLRNTQLFNCIVVIVTSPTCLLRYGERLVCPITLTPAPASNASRAEVDGGVVSTPLTRGTGLAMKTKTEVYQKCTPQQNVTLIYLPHGPIHVYKDRFREKGPSAYIINFPVSAIEM